MAPLVAVIIPVYNAAPYLERCLHSVFCQTYKNTLIFAIDDGSNDGSESLLEKHKAEHSNLIVIHKDNGGLSSARNAGLERALTSGATYVTFVDADDYVELDFVETMIRLAQRHDADITCASFDGFTGDRFCGLKVPFTECRERPLNRFDALSMLFEGKIQSHIPTKLFKASVWSGIRFDERASFMEDQKLTYRLFSIANSFIYTDYCGYNYFYGENSLVRSRFTNKKVLEALRHYYDAVPFHFNFANPEEEKIIHTKAETLFGSAYLMLCPRFYKKGASSDEIFEMGFYRNYIHEHKVISRARFPMKRDRRKRFLFMISERLYVILYRVFIRRHRRY